MSLIAFQHPHHLGVLEQCGRLAVASFPGPHVCGPGNEAGLAEGGIKRLT